MKLTYNNWMRYIHQSLNPQPVKKIVYQFGEIGNRTEFQIQEEIAHLRQLDKDISNKVRASYSIKDEK
tara:strand:+ start:1244 stop:1447 length:204 start_codon:yes stop_codon:yes gene_type:complete